MKAREVIHLYLGQKFLYKGDSDLQWSKPMELTADQLSVYYRLADEPAVSHKLILRPLSSMTKEDGIKIFGGRGRYLLYKKEKEENAGDLFLFTPNETKRLLELGYDIFSLHTSGECIYESEFKDK